MSQFKVIFNTDNAAFEGDPSAEAARILEDIKAKIQAGSTLGPIRDINGNVVGKFSFEK